MPRIAIVGGGLSGLSAAYELSRRGCDDFVLYEATSRLGGIVETHLQHGFVIECGADSWVTEKPWALELAVELGLEAEILPSNDARRRTYLLQGDRLVPMPDGMRMMVPADLAAIDGSPLFTETARQAYREEPSRAEKLKAFDAARPADSDESVARFVERHFGGEVAEKIAGPLLAGVFGGDIRKLSAAAVMANFVQMEREHGSLILGLQAQVRGGKKSSVFTSLKGGLQSLIDGMAAVIPASAVRLGEPVVSLAPRSGKWRVETAAGAAAFDQVVLAAPVHVARRFVALWNPELAALLDIEASSAVVAAFAFDREQSAKLAIPDGFGFLAPQGSGANPAEPELLACTFVHQKFDHRAPEGCALLRAFFGGDAAPGLLGQPDEAILGLARRRLSRVLGPLPEAKIALVRRWPLSLPQYSVGHRARVARIEAVVREIPGLHLVGNAFHGVGLPDLIRQGRALAEALSCSIAHPAASQIASQL
jgi:oxygen-dependent protoporphyrinogen oxidase